MILTECLHVNISRRTLPQLVGGDTAVAAGVRPGDDPDVEHGEVAQHPPVPVLPPGDLALGVGVHLAFERDGVLALHHGALGRAGHRHVGRI